MPTRSSSIRDTFSMIPTGGPNPRQTFTEGFFQVAAAQNPKPQTIALAGEDAEFSRNAMDGARDNAKKYGFKIVYDRTYPPNTTDFSPIVRAIQAANPDLVVHLLLSAELGRHDAVRQRTRPEAENVRRRHGRPAGDGVQEQAQIQAQRHRQLRKLGAVAETDGAGRGFLQEISGACAGARHRSARLLSRRLGLRPHAGAGTGHQRHQEHRRRQALPITCATMRSTPS